MVIWEQFLFKTFEGKKFLYGNTYVECSLYVMVCHDFHTCYSATPGEQKAILYFSTQVEKHSSVFALIFVVF